MTMTMTGGAAALSSLPAAASALAPALSGPAALPTGAATSFIFGYTMDEGSKISLLPPNDADVDQARVAAAPKLGPFHIHLSASFAGWPSACNMTSLAQLKALEPSITGLQGKPSGSKGEILGSGGKTPHDVECQFNLRTSFAPAGYTPSWAQINLEEIDSGAPASWAQELSGQKSQAHKYPAQYAYYPNLRNGVKCFDDGNELQCLKDDADFWVSGQKVTSGNFSGVDQAVWVDQIEIPLAEVIGAELTTAP
jgi:hypothetical protein